MSIKTTNTLVKILILTSLYSFSPQIMADSTSIMAANIKPTVHTVVMYDCFNTNEVQYTVTWGRMTSAYPQCPPDYIVDKINLRTEHSYPVVTDVDTYVSLHCCKTKVEWKTPA